LVDIACFLEVNHKCKWDKFRLLWWWW